MSSIRRIRRHKQPVHRADFRLILTSHRREDMTQNRVVANADGIILLNRTAPDTPHRLNRLLLRHPLQVFPDIPVAELIIGSVDIVRRGYNQVQFLMLRKRLHNIRIFLVGGIRDCADSHKQQELPMRFHIQKHNLFHEIVFDKRREFIGDGGARRPTLQVFQPVGNEQVV